MCSIRVYTSCVPALGDTADESAGPEGAGASPGRARARVGKGSRVVEGMRRSVIVPGAQGVHQCHSGRPGSGGSRTGCPGQGVPAPGKEVQPALARCGNGSATVWDDGMRIMTVAPRTPSRQRAVQYKN